jgi:hypothetical protein
VARIKKREHENLSDANIQKVISLLTPHDTSKKPITKKDACQILNITYNTARLAKIIAEYEERQEYVAEQKAKRRGKSATNFEIQQAVEDYLTGENYSTIAKRLFRSSGFVKAILERVGVPQRPTGNDAKQEYDYLPDNCISETFREGEIVWSAKYHRPARIDAEVQSKGNYLGKVYRIYVLEAVKDEPPPWFANVTAGGYFAYQPAYDLGKLSHLEKYGVDLTRI